MIKGLAFLKSALVVLAVVGVIFPQVRVLAGENQQPSRLSVKTLPANSILDVRLAKDGSFIGRTVDHTGAPVEGAPVVVKQGSKVIAQTVTDQQGQFAVNNMKTGVYQVGSGATEGTYRFWTEQSAPPSAKPNGLLVLGQNGARGQAGVADNFWAYLIAFGAAGAVAGTAIGIAATTNTSNVPASP